VQVVVLLVAFQYVTVVIGHFLTEIAEGRCDGVDLHLQGAVIIVDHVITAQDTTLKIILHHRFGHLHVQLENALGKLIGL